MKAIRTFAALMLAIGLAGPVLAQQATNRDRGIVVEGAWARATPPLAETGAVYFTIRNHGAEPDRLVGALTDRAKAAELHTHLKEGTVMRMRKVDAVEIAAGATVRFAPGGYHLMLIGLRAPLRPNEKAAFSLVFEKAGKIDVAASVRAPGEGAGHSHGGETDSPDGHQH